MFHLNVLIQEFDCGLALPSHYLSNKRSIGVGWPHVLPPVELPILIDVPVHVRLVAPAGGGGGGVAAHGPAN